MTAKIVEQTEKVEKVIRTASELPTGWKKACLVEIAEIIMGQSPSSEYYNVDRDGLPFFQGKAEFGDLYPEPVKWCSEPGKIAQKDDILISVRAPVGPTNLAPSECCIGRGLAAIRPREGIPSKYLLYYLRNIEASLDALGTGTTFKAISGKVLHAIPVPVAPPDQQNRIVAEIEKQFSRLDEAGANLKRVKANLKRYKAAVLKAAVEGKLTEEWRKAHPDVEAAGDLLKRILAERQGKWNGKGKYTEPKAPDTTNLATLPESWTWATLEQVSYLVQYGSSAKTSENPTGVPVLRMGNIADGKLQVADLKYLPKSHEEFPQLLLEPGDVLFNRTNSAELVGKTAVYQGKPKPCSFASYLIRTRLLNGCLPQFLAYYVNSVLGRAWIASVVSQQVGQANVNGTKLQALIIPLPQIEEQEQVVAEVERRLSMAENIEAAVGLSTTRVDRVRQSILARAFSAQLPRGMPMHVSSSPIAVSS